MDESARALFKRRSLRTRSLVVALIPLVALLVVIGVIIETSERTATAEEELRAGIQILADIHAVHASVAEAASGVRGFVLTGDQNFLGPFWRAETRLPGQLFDLRGRVRDTEVTAALVEIDDLATQKMEDLRLIIETVSDGNMLLPEGMRENKRLLDQIRLTIARMERREEAIIAAREQAAALERQRSLWLSVGAIVLAIGIAVAVATLFANDLIRRIQLMGENARLLAEGQAPVIGFKDRDELGQLGERLASASRLMSRRTEEAQMARAEAESANRAKTHFLSRMSHELRTPLNAILGFSGILDQTLEDPQARRHNHQVMEAGRHLLQLVNEVMDISRIETGALELELQNVALAPCLEQALKMIQPEAERRGVELPAVPPEAFGLTVRGDPQRLLQVFINLLSNAVKFNREQGRVTLTLNGGDRTVRIAVGDEGPGIDPSELDRLFLPFSRLSSAVGVEGTGLGLSLCKHLVDAMGGLIGVDSRPGEGAIFTVQLTRVAGPVALKPAWSVAAPDPAPVLAAKPVKRVLYVEDNASNRLLVETLLARRRDVELRSAPTLAEGRAAVDAWQPDALLLDLHLPDGSGLDLLAALRAEYPRDRMAVIVVSADVLADTREQAERLGADGFVPKPIDAPNLLRALGLTA